MSIASDAWDSHHRSFKLLREEHSLPGPISARFWCSVSCGPGSLCWVWNGTLRPDGYGVIHIRGRVWRVHRVSFVLLRGLFDPKMTLDHLCRNTRCVNPWHLEAVPSGVNAQRGNCPSALNSRKTHCVKGHPLSGDNIAKWKSLRRPYFRICMECNRLKAAANRSAKRLESQLREIRL